MATKKSRLEVLRSLLQEHTFESQEAILRALIDSGYTVAQPTLSRDLRALKVAKIFTDSGTYAYVLPQSRVEHESKRRVISHTYGFQSVEFSGNLAVIKTASGYASSLSGELDNLNAREVIGTVAGDDTIIVVLREGTSRNVINHMLKAVIPHYGE
ncbi:MAG: arginine repressor [Bacteroidaceae bacterium]|nr:arginine repressor [Bacteroidaceae bacterium]MBR3373649.1 arginine repressor [Bacteroidaceae bacterium]MBR3633097.1 arginine repressor [Bacteroidaceae bacterium]MBR3734123.1 arginine repressor [Bacteroidaceae bacterium]